MDDFVIEMRNITKTFPGIKANDNITLQLRRGEIHALLGENGAGKSTLMSVLFGLYQPDSGEIYKDGQKVNIRNPNDANALGIGMVHQHFKLVEVFSVLDNIILGAEDTKMGILNKKEARKKVISLSEKYGLRVDPDALIEDISVGMQQRVEILKMLYRDNDILIFDEPTAVLTPQEIDELMEIMRNFAKEGKSILFITHKLNEIMAVSDRCTVLRKGKYMGTVNISETSKEELSRMMVGRDVSFAVNKKESTPGKVVLSVQGVTVPSKIHKKNVVHDVSFEVREGEIVCLDGIEGNGQTEFVAALSGLATMSEGTILLNGKDISHMSISGTAPKRASAISRKTGTSTVWCWISRWKKTWCSSGTGNRLSRSTGSSKKTKSGAMPKSSLSSTTSAAARGRLPSRGACPAATSRKPLLPGKSTGAPTCWSQSSRPAAWTSARLSTSTSRSSACGMPEKPCCWSAWNWTK